MPASACHPIYAPLGASRSAASTTASTRAPAPTLERVAERQPITIVTKADFAELLRDGDFRRRSRDLSCN
jgi:hypothetical protein